MCHGVDTHSFFWLCVSWSRPPLYTSSPQSSSKIKTKRAKNLRFSIFGKEKRTRSDFWTRLRLLCFTLFGRSEESFWVFLCVWISFGDGGHRVNTFYSFYILPIDGMDWCFRSCSICWLYLWDRNTHMKCYSLRTSVHRIRTNVRYVAFWVRRQQEINQTLANTSLTTPGLRRSKHTSEQLANKLYSHILEETTSRR